MSVAFLLPAGPNFRDGEVDQEDAMDAKRTVLICEDDPVQLKIYAAALSQARFETVAATTPAQAVRQLGARRVDAVLSDVNLEQGSAFDLMNAMRRMGLDAPVVMISAYATPVLRQKAREQGVYGLFEKPCALDKVLRCVNKAVKEHRARSRRGRILVVEDHPQVRGLLQTVLGEAGFQVDIAVNGAQAIERVRGEIDLALVDMHLPGVSGAALIERLRQAVPGLYVVMMTGEASVEEVRAGYAAGAASFVRKPVSPARLVDFLDKSLASAAEMRRLAALDAERAARLAAENRRQRAWRAVRSFFRSSRRASLAAAGAAALLLGLAGAHFTDQALAAVETAERKVDRALETIGQAGPRLNDDSTLRKWYMTEQIRLGREAGDRARRFYDAQSERMSAPEPNLDLFRVLRDVDSRLGTIEDRVGEW